MLAIVIVIAAAGCGSTEELTVTGAYEQEPAPPVQAVEASEASEEPHAEAEDTVVIETAEPQKNVHGGLKLQFERMANNVTHLYITAQQLFYGGYSEQALIMIRQANEVRENADIRALKGSIYLSLGNREKFEENWKKAMELDKNVPIPSIPIIQQELQNLGLLD